jgi:hypothetical protein
MNCIDQNKTYNVTNKYKKASTAKILSRLERFGWYVDRVCQARVLKKDKNGFQKHLIILKNDRFIIDSENQLTLILLNSHDGTTSLRFNLGVYRLVCSNGLIVGDNLFEFRMNHAGKHFNKRLNIFLRSIDDTFNHVTTQVKTMQNMTLDDDQINEFKQIILSEFFDGKTVNVNHMGKIRRVGDQGNTLYVIFNRLQENLIRGGIPYTNNEGKKNTTRPIRNIKKLIDINKKLWTAAEFLAA